MEDIDWNAMIELKLIDSDSISGIIEIIIDLKKTFVNKRLVFDVKLRMYFGSPFLFLLLIMFYGILYVFEKNRD